MKKQVSYAMLTLIIFALTIIFFFPAKLNNICKPNFPCPPSNSFIKITEISTNSAFAGINYPMIFIELILSCVLSVLILKIYNKLNFLNKKIKAKHL